MKLAICEDNPVHYNMIHTLLKKYLKDSFEVTHFTSGDEFLRVVEGEGCPYSIVLTDIDLGSDDFDVEVQVGSHRSGPAGTNDCDCNRTLLL